MGWEGRTNVVGEGEALVVGDAADLLEDECVGAADGARGDDDDLCGGDSAQKSESAGELHVDDWE